MTRWSLVESRKLAERVRFELTVLAYTRVPGVHLKPLGHLSVGLGCNEWYYLNVQLQFINQKTLCQVKKPASSEKSKVSAPIFEEVSEDSAALFFQQSALDSQGVIQPLVGA